MARGLSKERIEMGEAAWAEHIRNMNNEKALKYRKSLHVVNWHRRTKLKLIEYKGGKCERCGYCKKCSRAYHFHHTDPSQKDFSVSQKTWSFERLKLEVDKCLLVCSNCHAELHDEEYAKIKETEAQKFSAWMESRTETANCLLCNAEFKPRSRTQRYCSTACGLKATSKVKEHPSKDCLQASILTNSWAALGRKFGASGNTVKKWAKQYGLEVPVRRRRIESTACRYCGQTYMPRERRQKFCSRNCHSLASRKVVRPSFEELVEMRKSQTLEQIGSRYNVNWCTVKQWINTGR